MRVLHVGKYYPPYPGGIENFVSDLATQQHHAGADPAVLVHSPPASAAPQKPADFPVLVSKTWGTMAYAPVSPGFAPKLQGAITRLQPDLLHLHLPNVSAFWALALPAARRLPWVVHWHSDVLTDNAPRMIRAAYGAYGLFESALLRRSRTIVATSESYAAHSPVLQRYADKTTVVPLGLNPERYHLPGAQDRSWAKQQFGAGFKVLGLGRLSHYKGFDILVEAAGSMNDVSCVIAGAGEQASALATQVRSTPGSINLCGAVSDGQARALMDAADVIVMPSVQRTEAFGLVLLEAMIAGKPVVASQLTGSGMPWVVARAGHGLLTEPGDVDALNKALATLKSDPARCEQMGAAGLLAFQEHFHIASIEREIAQVYEAVLS